jgi:transcriptional regulator with XRE-family HTH domain
MENFFKKLKETRELTSFTQQQMADKLGISIKQYQNYEKKTIPPHERLQKLNEILKYDFSKLLYEEKVPKNYQTQEETVTMVSDYKEKYLTALEEIRELQKQLLGKNEKE